MARKLGICLAALAMVLAVAPAGVALAAAGSGASSATAACRDWVHTKSPNAGSGDNNLYAVAAVSGRDAWAVGSYFVGANTKTLIEHWNGKSWKVVTSPNKGTGDSLNAIDVVSATNIWAVGSYSATMAGRGLIEHWNGKRWKTVPVPSGESGSNGLTSVRGTSGHDIWAVGNVVTSYPVTQTVILHYNGKSWKRVSSPNLAGALNVLTGVRSLSATNAWAVGYTTNGSGTKTLILHWTRHHWRTVSSPNVAGADSTLLRGVLVNSATSAWAVGDWTKGAVEKTVVLRWNGKHWRKSTGANAGSGGHELDAVGRVSSANAYAAGLTFRGTTSSTLIEHWDGKHWRVVPSRNPGSAGNNFAAVFTLSSTDIWAAGSSSNGGPSHTLIEHCR